MEVQKKKGNQSGEKLLHILEYMVEQEEPMRLLDISNTLELNSSTVLRFLTTLVNTGYVEQDTDSLKYYPTYKICALAGKMSMHTDIRTVARPYMQQLNKVFGESVCMAIEDNMKSVYIEVIRERNQSLMTVQSVGNSAPLHCTGIGKLFFLNYTETELERYVQVEGLTKFTDNTITSKWQLDQEIEKIRARGYSYDEEEREMGARCVAFPIYDFSNKIIAGISVTGPVTRLTDELVNPRLETFRNITTEISKKMGYKVFK
ncbi:MAG: IclR family transcriptional regulator [Marvinbryantia sp.]|jgi:DNA-binding IclR family transcriptional regulator